MAYLITNGMAELALASFEEDHLDLINEIRQMGANDNDYPNELLAMRFPNSSEAFQFINSLEKCVQKTHTIYHRISNHGDHFVIRGKIDIIKPMQLQPVNLFH